MSKCESILIKFEPIYIVFSKFCATEHLQFFTPTLLQTAKISLFDSFDEVVSTSKTKLKYTNTGSKTCLKGLK